jgi:hypothetical protein
MAVNLNPTSESVIKVEPPDPQDLNREFQGDKDCCHGDDEKCDDVNTGCTEQCDSPTVLKTEPCYDELMSETRDCDERSHIPVIKTEPCEEEFDYQGPTVGTEPGDTLSVVRADPFDVAPAETLHEQAVLSWNRLETDFKTEFQDDNFPGRKNIEVKTEFDHEDPGIQSFQGCSDAVSKDGIPAESGGVIVKVEEVKYESVLEQGTVEFNLTSDVDTVSTEMIIKMEGAGDDVIPKQEADLHHFGTDVPRGMLKIEVNDPLHPVPSRDVKLEEDEEEMTDYVVKTESNVSTTACGSTCRPGMPGWLLQMYVALAAFF